jgi:hypothetical protein
MFAGKVVGDRSGIAAPACENEYLLSGPGLSGVSRRTKERVSRVAGKKRHLNQPLHPSNTPGVTAHLTIIMVRLQLLHQRYSC